MDHLYQTDLNTCEGVTSYIDNELDYNGNNRLLYHYHCLSFSHLFKVNNRNTRKRCEISSKLTIKTPERRQWRRSDVFIVNSEHISYLFRVFLLLNFSWNISSHLPHFMPLVSFSTPSKHQKPEVFWCFHEVSDMSLFWNISDFSE